MSFFDVDLAAAWELGRERHRERDRDVVGLGLVLRGGVRALLDVGVEGDLRVLEAFGDFEDVVVVE